MKTSLKTLAVACTALAASGASLASNGLGTVGGIAYEQVRFYNPTTVSWPTQTGSVGTDHCTGTDVCGEPMTFTSAYGGNFRVTADDGPNNDTNGIVIQDLNPDYGGLGVVSLNKRNNVSGDDEIDAGETLTLTFSKAVTIVGLHFFDGDHSTTERNDKGKLRIDGGSFNEISLRSYVTADSRFWHTGKVFTFGHVNNDYYLGAVKLMQPVPEPGTYALMLAGLAAMGFVARRRRPG